MNNSKNKQSHSFRRAALPMLVASALASAPTMALELGNANVRSALGERMLIELPLAGADDVPMSCISARVANNSRLSVLRLERRADALVLRSNAVIRDPIIELRVAISCPNVIRLTRDYTLFFDPAVRQANSTAALRISERPAERPAARAQSPRVQVTTAQAVTPRPRNTTPITSEQYRVASGDTVSEIASRYKPAGVPLWPTVAAIVDANPNAFINGDADRLIAGTLINLPQDFSFDTGVSTRVAAAPTTSVNPINAVTETAIASPAPQARVAPAQVTPVAAAVARAVAPTQSVAPNTPSAASNTQTTALARPDADLQRAARVEVTNDAYLDAGSLAVVDSDSPFKPSQSSNDIQPKASTATDSDAPTSFNELLQATQAPPAAAVATGTTWSDRFVAIGTGVAGGLGFWLLWQFGAGALARRQQRTQLETTKPIASVIGNPSINEANAPVDIDERAASGLWRVDAKHAAASAPDKPAYIDFDTGDDKTEIDFEFTETHHSISQSQVAMDAQNRILSAGAPIEVEEYQPEDQIADDADTVNQPADAVLDDPTLELLERDYEEQLTRTQQLQKELAEQALSLTPQQADDSSATAQVPALGAKSIEDSLNEAIPVDFTESLPALDLDETERLLVDQVEIDDTGVSAILRTAADDLNAEIGEIEATVELSYDEDDDITQNDIDSVIAELRKQA
ncbi:MAG: hypothetical protein AAGA84_11150 [Pseudomonadota bacterium]